MASNIVETVNINLEDFSESFLTCSTCLCTYDQDKRKAKLLPCSHTVCLQCLDKMQRLPQTVESGLLRCPMCRDVVMMPVGGVTSLPSSFIINQLLDLMQRQRRDLIPNCSIHQHEQLLYCEVCDCVFCLQCDDPSKNDCSHHTVVPFSIAIRRMSEIVVLKAKQCISSLDVASKNVECETVQLDQNVDQIVEELNSSFQDVCQLVEKRRRELVDSVRALRDEKRRVLRDQMERIDSRRKRLERELKNCDVNIQEMGTRMKRVFESTDDAITLTEPRENAFLKLHIEPEKLLNDIEKSLSQFGSISGSTTFPHNCVIEKLGSSSVFTGSHLLLRTFDVNGQQRKDGGDPVKVEITKTEVAEEGCLEFIETTVKDNEDGTYTILFKVCEATDYTVRVTIFGRPIKNSPFVVSVSNHHSPKWQFGSQGIGTEQLNQPVKMCQDSNGYMYILDTGNNRIKILGENGEYIKDVTSSALSDSSTVGLSLLPTGDIITLNWRTKDINKCGPSGEPIQTMTFTEFVEPIDVCIDRRGRFLIADTSSSKVFVLDPGFRPLFSFSVDNYSSSAPITSVGIGLNDDILVGTCSSLLLFDGGGRFLRELQLSSSAHRGRMMTTACAVCPSTGNVVAAVMDLKRNRAHLAVCQYKGPFAFAIDSYGSRLRHPCGVCIGTGKWSGLCFVVDSATNSVKAFQYR